MNTMDSAELVHFCDKNPVIEELVKSAWSIRSDANSSIRYGFKLSLIIVLSYLLSEYTKEEVEETANKFWELFKPTNYR